MSIYKKEEAKGVPCCWMRAGTSKGGFFLADELPDDRDEFLLRAYGSPDVRQIDGMGGADVLTSKVAIVRKSARDGVDVEYLFLQVSVDVAQVSGAQNCGNMLAGVGPFAIERGLVKAQDGQTDVRVYMENTGKIAVASVMTPQGVVDYAGETQIDGVPGMAAPVLISFQDIAGASCGALLPSGNVVDVIDGVEVTLIDNGMPCVILRAADMGISGQESPEDLEANEALRARLEVIRLIAGPLMNLGDVREKNVPKMTMVSAPVNGGTISTRSFIPHRCHASIGVLAAVSVGVACRLRGSVAQELAQGDGLQIEHLSGQNTVVKTDTGYAVVRTARKLFDGVIYG